MKASAAAGIEQQLSQGAASAAQLAQSLRVSQATISRAVRMLEAQRAVLRIGSTRGARYGLRRQVVGLGSQWPLYRIDPQGLPRQVGELSALAHGEYFVAAGLSRLGGWNAGLPYFLQDARPAGFLGRAVPALFPELALPARVDHWTDEHALTYLVRRGVDSAGDLILGDEALNRHLATDPASGVVSARERPVRYPQFADAAMAGHPPGSSAQGEHPKFSAMVEEAGAFTAVIVKFSPPIASATGRRWADLLTAEHVAHQVLQHEGLRASRSALYEFAGRVFLECTRFDRAGAQGRLGTVTLLALDSARYGRLDSWSRCARRLQADSLLTSGDAESLCLLDAFGALIANNDRHFGNVTLYDRYEGLFESAPAYDMLPMFFAPQNDQIVPRSWQPPPPIAEWLAVWARASALAQSYWSQLARDSRLSDGFRALSGECLAALHQAPGHSLPV